MLHRLPAPVFGGATSLETAIKNTLWFLVGVQARKCGRWRVSEEPSVLTLVPLPGRVRLSLARTEHGVAGRGESWGRSVMAVKIRGPGWELRGQMRTWEAVGQRQERRWRHVKAAVAGSHHGQDHGGGSGHGVMPPGN